MHSYDVIVIGAGAAGLTAAQELSTKGIAVLVLEAQDYIGGRIKTYHEWGRPVELGAEFIHGSNTVTAKLAGDMGLKTVSAFQDRRLVDADGNTLSHDDRQQYYRLMGYIDANGRRGTSLAELIAHNPITNDPTLRRLAEVSVGDYEAGDADSLDSGAFSEMERRSAHDGENLMLRDGYQQIVERLAEGVTVRTRSIVTAIDYSHQTYIAVALASGETLHARQVIITVSLGVLQHGDIAFVPALPPEKRAIINRLGMGNVMKLILRLRDPQDVSALFRYADGDNYSLQTITCWWASAADPRVLAGCCGGSRAAAVLALPEDRLLAKVSADLGKLSAAGEPPVVVDYKISRWDDNPFVRGAYSNHPVGVGNNERRALARPTDNRLFWAGEATNASGDYGTVNGAIVSGYRAAGEALAAAGAAFYHAHAV